MQLSDRVTVFRDGRHVWTRPMADWTRIRSSPQWGVATSSTRTRPTGAKAAASPSFRSGTCRLPFPDVMAGGRAEGRVLRRSRPGEILGIGGLLGAGRTEILETILASNEGLRAVKSGWTASPSISARHAMLAASVLLCTEDRKAKGLHLHEIDQRHVALPLVGRLADRAALLRRRGAALAKGAVDALGVRCASTDQAAGTLSGATAEGRHRQWWRPVRVSFSRRADARHRRRCEARDLRSHFKLAGDGLAILVVSSELPELCSSPTGFW